MIFDKVSKLPEAPGVYMFKTKSGKILYIGKAKNLKNRVKHYFSGDIGFWKEDMISRAYDIDFILTSSEEEALLLENNLIKKYQPPYNSLLKGDTGYIYIKIDTKNGQYKFPQIKFTRFKENDGSIYIGPKPWKKELKKLLQFLRYIFQFRTCSNTQFKKKKLCSDYTFGLCKGWCVLDDNNINLVKEYKNIINLIIDFFNGNTEKVQKLILDEINKAVENQNFERAARLRDIYFNIQKFIESQTVVLDDEEINGYYFLVNKIGDYIGLILVKFFKGKLIDVIKYKQSGLDISEIKMQLINEIGEYKIFEEKKDSFIGGTYNYFNDDIKDFLYKQLESLIINSSFEKQNLLNDILQSIKNKLGLKNFPYKIEGLDISHLSGDRTSGGLVSMIGGILYKKGYRRYKIKSEIIGGDDYGALKEVLIRRFKLDKKVNIDLLDLPDLFVIDGGKGQIGILKDLLKLYPNFVNILNKIDFISIGKGEARFRKGKVLSGIKEKIYVFKDNMIKEFDIDILSEEEKMLLFKIRDESHRFANKYRQKQMEKNIFK